MIEAGVVAVWERHHYLSFLLRDLQEVEHGQSSTAVSHQHGQSSTADSATRVVAGEQLTQMPVPI